MHVGYGGGPGWQGGNYGEKRGDGPPPGGSPGEYIPGWQPPQGWGPPGQDGFCRR